MIEMRKKISDLVLRKQRAHHKKNSHEIESLKLLIGRQLCWELQDKNAVNHLQDTEFKVFSQFGDDGIIQYLIHHLDIPCKTFIEFGVEDYTESNTRFLLVNNNWKGLVIDGDENNTDFIRRDPIYWKHDLTAVCRFITKTNVNELFLQYGFKGELGILSIDIDGNDYWIWEEIHVVTPLIVIVEYNSVFGSSAEISIPYTENFVRSHVHYSNLYWGTSLGALVYLAEKKGYSFVGSNSAGNNAYFVRKDKLKNLKACSLQEGYVTSQFRESRDIHGNLNYLSGKDRLREIQECEVVDVRHNKKIKLKELL